MCLCTFVSLHLSVCVFVGTCRCVCGHAWMWVFIFQMSVRACLRVFACMYQYLNWLRSQHKALVGVHIDVRKRARYGPTLTSGPHGLSFRARNNLRMMFIYKHTPRRTRLRDLFSPHHHCSFFLFLCLNMLFFLPPLHCISVAHLNL